MRLWDVETGAARSILRGHTNEVNWVSYSPDGRTLATAGDDRTVQVWDAQTGTLNSTLSGHDYEVVGVTFTPDGRQVVSCDRGEDLPLESLRLGNRSLVHGQRR